MPWVRKKLPSLLDTVKNQDVLKTYKIKNDPVAHIIMLTKKPRWIQSSWKKF